jgi:cytochrome c oxidase subunit III
MATTSAALPHAEAHGFDNDRKVRLGFLFYVLTDVTLVLFLFASYVWLRAYNTGGGWFPFKGMRLPDQGTTNILLAMIVISALSFYVAYLGARGGNQALLRIGLLVALVLCVATLVGQIRFMGEQQFATGDGSFASSYILLSGYHVYHLLIGTFLGLALTIRAFRGFYSRERHLGLVTVGYFWYWMALMPVLLWLMVLLLPPQL